jgi:thiamine biosynthesis lipoprotein
MRGAFALLLFLQSIYLNAQPAASKKILNLMGSRFELVAIHEHSTIRDEAIQLGIREIKRIEALISSWDAKSETSSINKNAGAQPVIISEELFNLIERTIKISNLTGGAFDISFNSIQPVWVFDGSTISPPDSLEIAESVKKINFRNIILDRKQHTVFLKEKGMKIGFGAIGKGYAANRAKKIMCDRGIEHGMVNAGGDLIAWGKQEDGASWQVGIADPSKEKEYIAWLGIADMSVVTSGNYEKFVIIEGKKYGHIINPKTGWPVAGIKSVTLVSPDAELSDALATSVFVLGKNDGLALVNRLKNVDCLIIDEQNKIWTSDKLILNYY